MRWPCLYCWWRPSGQTACARSNADADGKPVDADRPGINVAESRAKGGSTIRIGDRNIHAMLDGRSLDSQPELLPLAREAPKTPGAVPSWP